MEPKPRPSGPGAKPLAWALVALSLLGVLLALVPFIDCPNCHGTGRIAQIETRENVWRCGSCEGRGKITLGKEWIHIRYAPTK